MRARRSLFKARPSQCFSRVVLFVLPYVSIRTSQVQSWAFVSFSRAEWPHPLWANSEAGGSLSISNHCASSRLGALVIFMDNGNARKSKIKCQLLLLPTKDSI